MIIQILFVALFLFNMVLIWLTVFTRKFEWYRTPGILILAAIPFFTVFFDQPRFELDHFWWIVAGYIAIIIGCLITGWAGVEFKKGGMLPVNIPQNLIATGPYRFFRHPQYLGLIFIWVGWWWVWAAVYAFYFGMFILVLIWIEAYLEEKFILEKLFGDKFREYRRQTGMFWIK